MLTMKQFMESIGHRITEGDAYCWQCFGSDAYRLDSWDGNHDDGSSATIVFDTKTQEVYQAECHDYANRRSYRITNPAYLSAFNDETKHRGVEDVAYDDVKFVDLEVDEDFVEKLTAIIRHETYDTRVMMSIEFEDSELLKYMKMAHDMDLTFNELVERALQNAIDSHNDQGNEPVEFCHKCGIKLLNAPGIGPFCPNKSCDVADGTDKRKTKKIKIKDLTKKEKKK